jgi:NAD(P)H-dependent FMN reductase
MTMIDTPPAPPPLRPVHVLGIGGSTRQLSKSRVALHQTLALVESLGATTQLADIRALDLPMYDADRPQDDYPPSVAWLIGEAMQADAYILCSPTYHGTITGAMKNALDILDYLAMGTPVDPDQTFRGKPVALMACGGGGQNVINALYHTTRALEGIVIPTVAIVGNDAIDIESGTVHGEHTIRRLQAMTEQLVDLAQRLRRPITTPSPNAISM